MNSKIAMISFIFVGLCGFANADSSIKTVEMSGRLFEQGVSNKDPILVLAAAKLRRSINLDKSERKADTPDLDGSVEDILTWTNMLDMAREFAQGDDALLGVIEDVEAENMKGVVSGQVYSISNLKNGKTDKYSGVTYQGGEYAEVYIEGKVSTDLNVEIRDQKNRLVCSDTDSSKIAYCGWRPVDTAPFSIHVINKGGQNTSYSLITN